MGKKQIFKIGDSVPPVPAGSGLVQNQIPWGTTGTSHKPATMIRKGLPTVGPTVINAGNFKGVSVDYQTRAVL